MLDDNKHTERVPVNLTEREFHDACKEAMKLDKKPAEFLRYAVRLVMYGTLATEQTDYNKSSRSD